MLSQISFIIHDHEVDSFLVHSFYIEDVIKLRSISLLPLLTLRMGFAGQPLVTLDLAFSIRKAMSHEEGIKIPLSVSPIAPAIS